MIIDREEMADVASASQEDREAIAAMLADMPDSRTLAFLDYASELYAATNDMQSIYEESEPFSVGDGEGHRIDVTFDSDRLADVGDGITVTDAGGRTVRLEGLDAADHLLDAAWEAAEPVRSLGRARMDAYMADAGAASVEIGATSSESYPGETRVGVRANGDAVELALPGGVVRGLDRAQAARLADILETGRGYTVDGTDVAVEGTGSLRGRSLCVRDRTGYLVTDARVGRGDGYLIADALREAARAAYEHENGFERAVPITEPHATLDVHLPTGDALHGLTVMQAAALAQTMDELSRQGYDYSSDTLHLDGKSINIGYDRSCMNMCVADNDERGLVDAPTTSIPRKEASAWVDGLSKSVERMQRALDPSEPSREEWLERARESLDALERLGSDDLPDDPDPSGGPDFDDPFD